MAVSPTTPPRSPLNPGREILFESYLYKTPPLDKLFVKWKKRWFVLSRSDPYDQNSLDLSYYNDHTKKEKRGKINLTKIASIRPNAKIGHKQNVFAIETEERKYILRAMDLDTKNVWLAKLCELCGQEPVYHVTVPNQPSAHYGEGIMKFNPSGSVAVISPAVGNTLMEVSLMDIRRVGYMYMYNRDIVWFETCKSCKNSHELDQFSFAIVQSGTATAQTLTRNLKMAIERSTGVFLILEESTPIEMAFVSRNHYGCPCYPSMSRNRILLGGMNNSDIHGINNMFQQRASEPNISVGVHPLLRRPSEPVQKFGLSLEEYVSNPQRRTTISTSPTTPYPPVRPPKLSRGPTSLDRFRQASTSSMSSQTSVDMFEEPPSLDGVFEASLPTFRRQLSKKGSIHSRNLSQQDSISSHGSAGSTGSSPLEDHHEEIEFSMMKRVSQSRPELRPNVPPRSPASLMTRSTTPDAL